MLSEASFKEAFNEGKYYLRILRRILAAANGASNKVNHANAPPLLLFLLVTVADTATAEVVNVPSEAVTEKVIVVSLSTDGAVKVALLVVDVTLTDGPAVWVQV